MRSHSRYFTHREQLNFIKPL